MSDLSSKIQLWRQKCREGSMTTADYKEALADLRQGRELASVMSTKARTAKAKKPAASSDDLLSELDGL